MKLFVTTDRSKAIEGYQISDILHSGWNLSSVAENSQSHIVAMDAIDHIKYDRRSAFVTELTKKLRKDAKLVIIGIDLLTVIDKVRHSQMSIEEYNHLLESVKSLGGADEIVATLREAGLKINTLQYKGDMYEIIAGR